MKSEKPGREANPIPNSSRPGLIDVTCVAATLVSPLTVPSRPVPSRHSRSPASRPSRRSALLSQRKRQRRHKEFSNSHSPLGSLALSARPRRIICGGGGRDFFSGQDEQLQLRCCGAGTVRGGGAASWSESDQISGKAFTSCCWR